jgi:hypothetical protein
MSQQSLPEGAFLLPADVKRIENALNDLKQTKNAHAQLTVQVNLHVHYEYPKHITLSDKNGSKTVVVESEAEELAAYRAFAAAQPLPVDDAGLGGSNGTENQQSASQTDGLPPTPAPAAPTTDSQPQGQSQETTTAQS